MRASSPDVGRALEQSVGQLGSGGRTVFDDVNASEASVRRNAERNQPWTTAQIRENPNAFLRNVTQLDGNRRTDRDHTACGPTAMVMAMIAGRPESVQQLASQLIDAQGEPTSAAAGLLSQPDAPATREALTHLRSGRFSASDITTLSGQLLRGASDTSGEQLMVLRASISNLGVQVPPMELQQFGAPDGSMGHWRASINGTQYNPWPNAAGQAGITREAPLRAGMADGDGFVCREKLFTDGAHATRNIYSVHDMLGQDRTVTSDPPLLRVQYELNAAGDTMVRGQVDAARAQELTNHRVTPQGIDSLLSPSIDVTWAR